MAIIKELYDTTSAVYLLGSLMQKPSFALDDNYMLTEYDFVHNNHKIIFSAIYNIAQKGVQRIVPNDIDIFLRSYDKQYEIYTKNNGLEFTNQCYETAAEVEENKFKMKYDRIKKFSILRDLERVGIDTKRFYNTEENLLNAEAQLKKLDSVSIDKITEVVRGNLAEIDNAHIGHSLNVSQEVSKGLESLVEGFKTQPEIGLPLGGGFVNAVTRGARQGKFYIYSAPSGQGKTRYMVGNACSVSMPYIDNFGQISVRENGYEKVLFVATEMDVQEIQTLVLAYVSGVNEEHILQGRYAPGEWERIETGIKIIELYKDNFIVECIPDPSIHMIKSRIVNYIYNEKVNYIFYDYIFTSPGLLGEFSGADVKEYTALMMLSNSLKEIAMQHKVFMQSATQLNENWAKKETGQRDQNMLRGSKAIADKIDVGLIGVKILEAEKKEIAAVLQELMAQKSINREPNVVIDIYKNRRGKISSGKIFRYFDFGTCRSEDLFITDSSYKRVTEIDISTGESISVRQQLAKEKSMDFLSLVMKTKEQEGK